MRRSPAAALALLTVVDIGEVFLERSWLGRWKRDGHDFGGTIHPVPDESDLDRPRRVAREDRVAGVSTGACENFVQHLDRKVSLVRTFTTTVNIPF